jgi:hypothetical protein
MFDALHALPFVNGLCQPTGSYVVLAVLAFGLVMLDQLRLDPPRGRMVGDAFPDAPHLDPTDPFPDGDLDCASVGRGPRVGARR